MAQSKPAPANQRGSRTFQPPKGTRDFYPAEMAVRRHIENVWREVSIDHGFDEIEGPTFEHLDLYTKKSGEEIVSQLFRFRREGGDTDYALRPEFTPTLARMYAAKARSLPAPTKWFCIPSHFRAERPQRGRLREFMQWNADIIGDDSPRADAEIIAVTVGVLERLGLTPNDVRLKIGNRQFLDKAAEHASLSPEKYEVMRWVQDNFDRLSEQERQNRFDTAGITNTDVQRYIEFQEGVNRIAKSGVSAIRAANLTGVPQTLLDSTADFLHLLDQYGLHDWWDFDTSIVRGLAYYTGTVFEVHEATGKERAIAGGGRYDGLIELFGGPPTPAVGIAMGDVVLRFVLQDKGLLKPGEEYLPRPDVFVISTGDEIAQKEFTPLVAKLRREGFHVRHSYRATRNLGKLLGEASKVRARFAVILGKELAEGNVVLKNLDTGEERPIPLDGLAGAIRKQREE